MIFNKNKCHKFLLFLIIGTRVCLAYSEPKLHSLLKQGHPLIQLGGFWSYQGQQQHINIQNLIGDEFTVTKHDACNGLIGVGYFIDGQKYEGFNLSYGLNAFYLAKTAVTGEVIQENLFTNLSYHYNITHYPLYAVAKSDIKTKWPKYGLTIDVGMGPNFMRTSSFNENSLDGISIPDTIFAGRTTTQFSATVGVGLKLNQFFSKVPLECGYRFFYLGQGHFDKLTSQVLNTLNTGSDYANAVICSITF